MPLDPHAIAAVIADLETPFSGVAQVRQGGADVFAAGYGYAIRSEEIPNRVDTRFATASGSKIFTAVAALSLVEAGQITLETPIADVLDIDYPLDPAIQLRHLLTHTSGLPDYYDEDTMSDEDCMALMAEHPVYTWLTPADYLPLFPDGPAKFPPGEGFHYNNGAFVLLALLIERVSGQPFHRVVRERVFAPAGMADSGYFRTDALPPRTAYGYMQQPDGSARANFFAVPVIGSGDGGAYVTAADWTAFWDALYGYRLLGQPLTDAMLAPQVDTGHETLDRWYGYGVWIIRRAGAAYERYVVGGDFGVGMVSARFPGYDVEMTLLDNTGDAVWSAWGALVKHFDTVLGV